MRLLLLAIAALALAGCAAPFQLTPKEQAATYKGVTYRLLSGNALRAAIVGKRFSFPNADPGVVTSPRCETFYEGGTFVQCGDRVPRIYGTYYFMLDDLLCTSLGYGGSCMKVFAHPTDGYLIEYLNGRDSSFERVQLEPIP